MMYRAGGGDVVTAIVDWINTAVCTEGLRLPGGLSGQQ